MPKGKPDVVDYKIQERESQALDKFRNMIEEQLWAGTDPNVVAKRISALANTLVRAETIWNLKKELIK